MSRDGQEDQLVMPGIDPPPRLFEPGPAAPELSAGRKLTIRNQKLLAAGIHPVSGFSTTQAGRCGDCVHHITQQSRPGRTFHKCDLNVTNGPGTDIRVSWPSCTRYDEVDC